MKPHPPLLLSQYSEVALCLKGTISHVLRLGRGSPLVPTFLKGKIGLGGERVTHCSKIRSCSPFSKPRSPSWEGS